MRKKFTGKTGMTGKKRVKKLHDHADLYDHFGEMGQQSISFVEEFDIAVTDSDIEKGLKEKEVELQRTSSLNELLSSYPQPQRELDLHGMTSESAERRVKTFLWESSNEKFKTVRIITGKGLHSDGPAVLPDVTEMVLKECKYSGNILHYQWEKKARHKSGAVIVYLR